MDGFVSRATLIRMILRDRVAATLLGTALGDALGLPCEGMSARRIARRFGRLDRYRLLGRTGYVSDDTEQSALVAQSLAKFPTDPDRCARAFRRSLVGWFWRLPWGVGLATVTADDTVLDTWYPTLGLGDAQIGRASCRERV